MATPSLKTFEISVDKDYPDQSPILRSFDINTNSNAENPIVNPLLRTFEVSTRSDPDTTPPIVSLDNPVVGDYPTGVISMEATASDPDSGIDRVDFLIDSGVVDTVFAPPYETLVNTAIYADGPHNFQAKAYNGSNVAAATPTLNLIIDNSVPLITLDSPTTGPVTGIVQFQSTASDPHSGIDMVELLVDAAPSGSSTSPPYSINFDTSLISDGPHDFQTRATNNAGLVTLSNTVSGLITDSSPPTATVLQPTSSVLAGSVPWEVDAQDPHSGISIVEILMDGVVIDSDTTNTYSGTIDTTLYVDGTHALTARATNGAGLTYTTASVQIVILNSSTTSLTTCDPVNDDPSDVAVRADYLYKILTNFLSLFGDEDREFLTRYWGGMKQIADDSYLQLYQNNLSKNIFTVPVYRRSKWNEIILSHESLQAEILSTSTAATFDTVANNTVTIIIDGNPVAVIFTGSVNDTRQNVVNEINAQATAALPGLQLPVASIDGDRIVLRSIDYGEEASIAIDELDGNFELGLSPGVSATGSGISTRSEPAQIIGSSTAAIYDTSISGGSNSIEIDVNEAGPIIITFPDDTSTTIITAVDTINSFIPGLASISAFNEIVLTTSTSGRSTSILIPPGGGNAELGFISGQFSLGSGKEIDLTPLPDRPISYEIIVGTSNDNLELVPLEDPSVVSIPALRSRIDGPTLVLGQADSPHLGTDEIETNLGTNIDPNASVAQAVYVIRDGRIYFSRSGEALFRNGCLTTMWAEDVYRNDTYLTKNFGFPIEYERDNSIEYKNVLQGLHHSYWTGPIVKRTEVGLNLLFDLPTAPVDGKVQSVTSLSEAFILGTEAGDTFDVSGVNRTFAFTVDGKFIFVILAPGASLVDQQNYPAASVISDINTQASPVLGFGPATAFIPDPGQPTIAQVKLTGQNSVRIDTVVGNAALGFPPGDTAFGQIEIVIGNTTFVISSEFPVSVQPGDTVERLDPLTDGVEVLHYITDPIWWEVFGLATLDSNFNLSDGYTQADLKMINEILKYHVFGVKIVPDAFTRLGDIELGVVSKFVNDVRGLTKNFIFLVPFMLLDVVTLTDDRDFDLMPDRVTTLELFFPPNMDAHIRNYIGSNENAGIHPDSTSYSVANNGITEFNFSDGTFVGPTIAYELDGYDVFASNGGSIDVIQGIGPVSYQSAVIESTTAGPYDTTSYGSTPLTFRINGSAVTVIASSNPDPDEIPLGTSVSAVEIASAITAAINAVGVAGTGHVGTTLDQKLQFKSDIFNSLSPTIEMITAQPDLGIPSAPGTVVGNGGTIITVTEF